MIDQEFVSDLAATGVDACGENGEYHSFAFAGPIFRQPVKFKVGEKIYRPVEQTHPGSAPHPSPVCPLPGARLALALNPSATEH